MTTEQTTNLSACGVLEQLAHVEPDPTGVALVAELDQLLRQHGTTLRKAREWINAHDAAAVEASERVRQSTGCDDEVDDGIYSLLTKLAGADDVFAALKRIADLADPDVRKIPDEWC